MRPAFLYIIDFVSELPNSTDDQTAAFASGMPKITRKPQMKKANQLSENKTRKHPGLPENNALTKPVENTRMTDNIREPQTKKNRMADNIREPQTKNNKVVGKCTVNFFLHLYATPNSSDKCRTE